MKVFVMEIRVWWLIWIIQLTSARYSRQIHNPTTSYFLAQQAELNPEVQFSFDDLLGLNYKSSLSFPAHNSIEKPVDEPQEYVPPQSVGAASIPLLPPPAVPVNAAAANVPTANGAVYLGSGSIGVVRLGNGAYALGSGSLGYSDGRSQPRPSIKAPVYPRLPASPNLIPAAVPSQTPQPPQPQIQGFHYVYPSNFDQDPNAYEVLRPDSAGFGTPVFRPPRPLRMHFATPTNPGGQNHFHRGQYAIQLSPNIPGSIPEQIQYFFNHQK